MQKLKITTHSGNNYDVEVENYNAQELNDQFNNHELNTVCVGDLILSRIDIKSISPIEI